MLALTPHEPFGILNQSGLDSAQCRPAQFAYFQQTHDIFTLAAVLGEALVQNHCFMNANKRTAAGCVYEFLMLNGWELTAPGDDVVILWEGVAMHEYELDEIADWLAYWSREFDTSKLND
ncbi:type II toxin-antitoxin system death-on-curing family toxin [Larsenimonas suaedae]|nr:type II toxin-antitoxin system death-on-curing family toxin [Larsenimonas suaedae]